jgi:hypothetical protein
MGAAGKESCITSVVVAQRVANLQKQFSRWRYYIPSVFF